MKPFNKFKLNDIRVDIDPGDGQCDALYTVTAAICAKIEDLTDEAIVQEIIQTAQKAGITDLWILDKNFILDALREKAEREDPKPLTYEELLKMHGEPVYVTVPGKPHRSKWCIVESCCPQPGLHGLDYFCDLLIVCTNAVKVYRHKPKGE